MNTALNYEELEAVFLRVRTELMRHIRYRVRCAETAADLTQDLFLRLRRLDGRLPNESEARRYLFRMATNIAFDHSKISQNRARLLQTLRPLYQEASPDADHVIEMRSELNRVEFAIALLPTRQQTTLVLSRLRGLTYAEIGDQLGISSSLVEKEVAAALRTLAHTLATASGPVSERSLQIVSQTNVGIQ